MAYLCLPKWCCVVACKQTKDKHIFVNVSLKLLSPEAFYSHKCTKFRLAAGLCPDPLGSLQRSPNPLLGLRGLLLRGGKERRNEGRDRRGEEVEERVGEWGICVIGLRGDGRPWCSLYHSLLGCVVQTNKRIWKNGPMNSGTRTSWLLNRGHRPNTDLFYTAVVNMSGHYSRSRRNWMRHV